MAQIDYHKKKFLIIEDHAEFRSSLKAMTRIFGAHMVDSVHDGEVGIAKIINNHYDIILSDYELGKGKDGQQILEETRHSGLLKASSVFVLITAATTVEMVMGALEYEPDGYITKPITHENLKTRLDKIMLEKSVFQEVDQAIDAKKYKQALLACDKIAKEQPKYQIKALRIKSKLLLNLERYDDAAKLYNAILAVRDLPWARLGLGKITYFKGDYAAAFDIFQKLALEDKRNVEAFDWLAKVYLSQNNPIEAQKALLHAIERSPKSVLRQMELGQVALSNQDWAVAEVALRKAVNLGRNSCYRTPHNYSTLVQVLQHKIKSTDSRKAKDALTEALRLIDSLEKEFADNKDAVLFAKILMAETQGNLGKAKEAELILNSLTNDIAAAEETFTQQMAQSLANAYESIGRGNEAQNLRTKYQATSRTELNNNDGLRLYKAGHLMEALAIFREAAKSPEADNNVLLNALQTSLSALEANGNDELLMNSCQRYLSRLSHMTAQDKNYPRFQKLNAAYSEFSSQNSH
ncbi:MAG TPA: response regulator [Pseudomonadales bacterium]|nr:response regulator [Pseudomonadales bacterium]